jgi:hypothetical protein
VSDFPVSQHKVLSSSCRRSLNENYPSALQEKVWLNLVLDQYPDYFGILLKYKFRDKDL